MKKLHATLLLALSLGAIGPITVYASSVEGAMKDQAEANHDATMKSAKAQYDAAKAHCKSMSGNPHDVCMKDAKAAYITAKSQAKADEKAGKAQADATDDQLKAEYKAVKERCEALSGSAEDACISSAKLKYNQ
jgi:hypothetical protein